MDKLWKRMHRYVSPVFLALLVASFILWYIAKLNYVYTTEQVVRLNVDGELFDLPCVVEDMDKLKAIVVSLLPKKQT